MATTDGDEMTGMPEGATPIYDVNGSTGMADVIRGLEDQVYAMTREAGNAPKDFKEGVEAFVAAVNWNERWIQGLLVFHLLLWTSTLCTRRAFHWQCGTFFFICLSVWASESVNTYAHMNWQAFSTQDYFDAHGFFMGVMFSGPLLMLALFQMVNFLLIASNLLVEVKREELKRSKEEAKPKEEITRKKKSKEAKKSK